MFKVDALQNTDIFLLGCTVEGSRLRALLGIADSKKCQFIAGHDVTLVEPYRANNTKIIAVLPDDLEPLYTYLDLEILNCASDLMGN